MRWTQVAELALMAAALVLLLVLLCITAVRRP
jgi:hypothetical protein